MFDEERICTNCGAWLWVVGGDVMQAAARLFTMSLVSDDDHLDAVLAGVAATQSFQREFQWASSAAWPSATVNRFS